MKGFKLKDGSLWTIISYETVSGCEDKTESQVLISDIVSFTGVEWKKVGMTPTRIRQTFQIASLKISTLTMIVY